MPVFSCSPKSRSSLIRTTTSFRSALISALSSVQPRNQCNDRRTAPLWARQAAQAAVATGGLFGPDEPSSASAAPTTPDQISSPTTSIRSPLFEEHTQRTIHGVELTAHDDFEESIERIEMYFQPRFHTSRFLFEFMRHVLWPLAFLFARSNLSIELGLVRLAVYAAMGFGAAAWALHCSHDHIFEYCTQHGLLECDIPATVVFMPFALTVVRAVYRSIAGAFFTDLNLQSTRKLHAKRAWQTMQNFRKHHQKQYQSAAARSRTAPRTSSVDHFPLQSLQAGGGAGQDGAFPTFIIVLGKDDIEGTGPVRLSTPLKAAWASFCADCASNEIASASAWLVAPLDENLDGVARPTGKFGSGISLQLSDLDAGTADPLTELTETDLSWLNCLRVNPNPNPAKTKHNEEQHQHQPTNQRIYRFRQSFISKSVYRVVQNTSGDSTWYCEAEVEINSVKSSEITIGMLLTHKLIKNKGDKLATLVELPVSEYARSPRYVYCHAIASISDEKALLKKCKFTWAPILGLIHGLIPIGFVLGDSRYKGDGAIPWVALVLSGLAGAYWIEMIVFDLIRAYALYRERKHTQLAISMLYDNSALFECHGDERYRKLKTLLRESIHDLGGGRPAVDSRFSGDNVDSAPVTVASHTPAQRQTRPRDTTSAIPEPAATANNWQFEFSNDANGRADLRSWFLVRRTMALLSDVGGHQTNILLGVLLVVQFLALLIPVSIGIHFSLEEAFSVTLGVQLLYDALILTVFSILIFFEGQVANSRQERDKIKLTFKQYQIQTKLSCSSKLRSSQDNTLTNEGQHLEMLAIALGAVLSIMHVKDSPLTLLGFPLTMQSLGVFSGGIVTFFSAVVATQLPSHFLGC